MPSKIEEMVLARARYEAELDVRGDFVRIEHFVETDAENILFRAMEARAIEKAVRVAEDKALRRLQRRLDRQPNWLERLLMRWEGLL